MSCSFLTSKDRPGHTTPLFAYREACDLTALRKERQQISKQLRGLKRGSRRRLELIQRLRDLTTHELTLSNQVDLAPGRGLK